MKYDDIFRLIIADEERRDRLPHHENPVMTGIVKGCHSKLVRMFRNAGQKNAVELKLHKPYYDYAMIRITGVTIDIDGADLRGPLMEALLCSEGVDITALTNGEVELVISYSGLSAPGEE